MNMELQATPEEVMRAVEAAQEFGRRRGMTEQEIFGLGLAIEESGSNIVNHALGKDPSRTFRVTIQETGGAIIITLRDRGPEFDPMRAAAKDASDETPGGWGIQLVRRFVDEISYAREAGENILSLTKHITKK